MCESVRSAFLLTAIFNLGGGFCRQRSPFRVESSHLDPGFEGHHVHDLHLWVHAHLEEASLPRLWEGLLLRRPHASVLHRTQATSVSLWCFWQVVCQACSTNKYYLEYLKNQPARVCDHCFAKLKENSKWDVISKCWTDSKITGSSLSSLLKTPGNTKLQNISFYGGKEKANSSLSSQPCWWCREFVIVCFIILFFLKIFLFTIWIFFPGDRCASTSVSPIKSGAFSFTRKQKKIPAALKEVKTVNC